MLGNNGVRHEETHPNATTAHAVTVAGPRHVWVSLLTGMTRPNASWRANSTSIASRGGDLRAVRRCRMPVETHLQRAEQTFQYSEPYRRRPGSHRTHCCFLSRTSRPRPRSRGRSRIVRIDDAQGGLQPAFSSIGPCGGFLSDAHHSTAAEHAIPAGSIADSRKCP